MRTAPFFFATHAWIVLVPLVAAPTAIAAVARPAPVSTASVWVLRSWTLLMKRHYAGRPCASIPESCVLPFCPSGKGPPLRRDRESGTEQHGGNRDAQGIAHRRSAGRTRGAHGAGVGRGRPEHAGLELPGQRRGALRRHAAAA